MCSALQLTFVGMDSSPDEKGHNIFNNMHYPWLVQSGTFTERKKGVWQSCAAPALSLIR